MWSNKLMAKGMEPNTGFDAHGKVSEVRTTIGKTIIAKAFDGGDRVQTTCYLNLKFGKK
jgi:hypothetical protein